MNSTLKYDTKTHPKLKLGYNDINKDGIFDSLLFIWNNKKAIFISDDGVLPWSLENESRDWNTYFNTAFNVGAEPPVTWDEIRCNWGSYTIMVDKDNCGRFDSPNDFYYKAIDLNEDGRPEAEFFHIYPGIFPYSNKLHINLSGESEMSYIDFKNFQYENEQRYLDGGKYVMNVHGSGFFLNSFSNDIQKSWENPIAWYDFDFDGFTNMVMRACDMHVEPPHLTRRGDIYEGNILEFELAFELNSNTSKEKYHSLDMQLTYYNYVKNALDYQRYVDYIPKLAGLAGSDFLSKKMLDTRWETIRRYIPYMDGYKICTDNKKWDGVWLIFDEDDDDCRWEEMFSKHETVQNSSNNWYVYSDRIGDRIEIDSDFNGEGMLYIGKFDGRIHLYHAETAQWDVDYFGMYKGSIDRLNTAEGPQPPIGLRYPRIKYYDKNQNGFIDTIEYTSVEYGNEENTEITEKIVSLMDYRDQNDITPDVCQLFDPRVDSKPKNWSINSWNGNPLTDNDFRNTACKDGYDKIYNLYTTVCENMWSQAVMLYETAKEFKLNTSENLDKNIKTYTRDELLELKEISIPDGYSRHLQGNTRREKYNNGFWLKEKVFLDILQNTSLDNFMLEKLYYTGRISDLCDFIKYNIPKTKRNILK